MRKSMKIITTLLCIVLLGIAIFAGYQIVSSLFEYGASERTYEGMQQYIVLPGEHSQPEKKPDKPANEQPKPENADPTAPTEEVTVWPTVDFEALKDINPDVVGWIYIEGTNISYPVMQGTDNIYYLRHMIDGGYNRGGSIFLDYRNYADMTDRHTIIHGHNMQNDSMFAALMGYKEQKFFEEHPTVLYMTPEKNYKIEVFSGYVADERGPSWKLNFESDEDYGEWLDMCLRSSGFKSDIVPTVHDQVVTLSTCSYEYFEARFVLVGVLREG